VHLNVFYTWSSSEGIPGYNPQNFCIYSLSLPQLPRAHSILAPFVLITNSTNFRELYSYIAQEYLVTHGQRVLWYYVLFVLQLIHGLWFMPRKLINHPYIPHFGSRRCEESALCSGHFNIKNKFPSNIYTWRWFGNDKKEENSSFEETRISVSPALNQLLYCLNCPGHVFEICK
jgi:hypothetical protein